MALLGEIGIHVLLVMVDKPQVSLIQGAERRCFPMKLRLGEVGQGFLGSGDV